MFADLQQYGSPYISGGRGWGIFNGILGWQNSATYGSVISYNVYWIAIIAIFLSMRYNEVKGHWPLMKGKQETAETLSQESAINGTTSETNRNDVLDEKN
jgi:high-affinity iron transporter